MYPQGRFVALISLLLIGCSSRAFVPGTNAPVLPLTPYVEQGGEQGKWVTFPLPAGQNAEDLYPGPDGATWLVLDNAIGRMDMSGDLTTYPTHYLTPAYNAGFSSITNNRDGNLYFLEGTVDDFGTASYYVGKITTSGQIQDLPMPTGNWIPESITSGSDGDLWITLYPSSSGFIPSIARMTTTGKSKVFTLPRGQGGFDPEPAKIVRGPDGNLWFWLAAVGPNPGGLGVITTHGTIRAYQIGCPDSVAVGHDGGVWSYDENNGGFCRTDPATLQTTEYVVGGGFTGGTVDLEQGPGKTMLEDQGGVGVIRQFNTSAHRLEKSITQPATSFMDGPLGADGNLWLNGPSVSVYVFRQISTDPTSVTLAPGSDQPLGVTEMHYTGEWSASSSDVNVATITPADGRGPFTITGVSPGSVEITVEDTRGNNLAVPVTVESAH